MKSRYLLLFFIFLLITIVPSCQKEDKEPENSPAPPGAKIKRILIYPDIDSTTPLYIESEYEYDSLGRISRVNHPLYNGVRNGSREYEIYQYDAEGRLHEISNYNQNAEPVWIRLYTYSPDGRLYKISTGYSYSENSEYSIYFYEADRLVKTENYGDDNSLANYTLNEYNNQGELTKESDYSPGNQLQVYTLHSYSDSLQILSEIYTTFPEVFKIRRIERTFDRNGNLEILLSKELAPWSSRMSYKLKYEYF